MNRIPITHLEQALKNPQEYRTKLDNNSNVPASFGRTYFGALRDSLFKYHQHGNDFKLALSYLNRRLKKFENPLRKDETRDQLEWYVNDVEQRDLLTFQNRMPFRIILPKRVEPLLYCSGEVCRIDMNPSIRVYIAWLIRSDGDADIFNDISMPLIQNTIARNYLHVRNDSINVGVYCFKKEYVDLMCYTQKEMNEAQRELNKLLLKMGY